MPSRRGLLSVLAVAPIAPICNKAPSLETLLSSKDIEGIAYAYNELESRRMWLAYGVGSNHAWAETPYDAACGLIHQQGGSK